MESIMADMSAILAIGAAMGATLSAHARWIMEGPITKLAIARIDNRRAMKKRIFTVLV